MIFTAYFCMSYKINCLRDLTITAVTRGQCPLRGARPGLMSLSTNLLGNNHHSAQRLACAAPQHGAPREIEWREPCTIDATSSSAMPDNPFPRPTYDLYTTIISASKLLEKFESMLAYRNRNESHVASPFRAPRLCNDAHQQALRTFFAA